MQAILFVALLLASGGVIGNRHRERVEAAEWWANSGSQIIIEYFAAFERLRRNTRTLPLEEVERQALASVERRYNFDARARGYLGEPKLDRIGEYFEDGAGANASVVQGFLLQVRFFRGDYEAIVRLAEDASHADPATRRACGGEANRALFLRSGEELYARAALRHFDAIVNGATGAPSRRMAEALVSACEALRDLGEVAEAEFRLRGFIASASDASDVAGLARTALARLLADAGRSEEAEWETRRAFAAASASVQRNEGSGYDLEWTLAQDCLDCWRKLGWSDGEILGVMTEISGEAGVPAEALEDYLDWAFPDNLTNAVSPE